MKTFSPRITAILASCFLVLIVTAAQSATYTVTSTADSGVGTLRQAFLDANASGGADTILFDQTLDGQIIILSSQIEVLNNTITINGGTITKGITISGGGTTRHFSVNANVTLNLFQVTLTAGSSAENGGSISNQGTLFVSQCTFSGNTALQSGGAIDGAFGSTGGVEVRNCTFSGNSSTGKGGALSCNGDLIVTHCTLSGNSTGIVGGGIWGTHVTISQSIVAGNAATSFPQAGDVSIPSGGVLTRVGQNIIQTLLVSGGSQNGPAALTGDPLLAPLGNYGGFTQTMPPLNGSPAIDPVGGATTSTVGGSDQRGFTRVVDATGSNTAIVDIGAVETGDFVVKTSIDAALNSLRTVILSAATPGQLITFAPGLNGATISLSSEIVLNKNVVLDARDLEDGITLSGALSQRHFYVEALRTVEMHRLKLIDGRGRGTADDGSGGAIANRGTLLLNQCTFSGNRAQKDNNSRGGAVFSRDGLLTLTNCTLNGNIGTGSGGAIHSDTNLSGQKTRLSQCTLTGNSTQGRGGAVNNFDGLTELIQCTITGNVSGSNLGGGVASYGNAATETVCVNTIIAGNFSPDVDLVTDSEITNNSFTSQGHNLIGSGSGVVDFSQTGDQSGVADPLLASLADNGGPTQTRLPTPDSPALDAGGATLLTTDQRGFARVVDGDDVGGAVVDIGAAESTSSDFIAGAVTFAQAQVKVSEKSGTVQISLLRTGGSYGEVSVLVNSTAGTATSGLDFQPLVNEPVTFADGQTEVSVAVTLVADPALKESHETFTLTLSAPTGDATLGVTTSFAVVILDAVDTIIPTVAVTSPKSNAAVAETNDNNVLITGSAKDDKGIARIFIQINGGSLSQVPVVSSDIKNGTWSILMPVVIGINTLTIYSQDDLGNVSKTLVSKFNYQVKRSLTVSINGPANSGTVVKGFVPTSDRFLGVSYKISAAAKSGFVFSGWTANSFADTGVTDAAKELPALTFIMKPGLALTANFIANPFTSQIAGSYNGLVKPVNLTPIGNATVGLLTASVTSNGSFSATLKMDGATHSLAGVFNTNGESRFGKTRTSTLPVKRKGKSDLAVSLELDLDNALLAGVITQTLPGDIQATSGVTADRAHYSSKSKVDGSLAGTKEQRYHIWTSNSLANPLPLTKYPYGSSVGYMKINTSGLVSYGGKLADDTSFTGSAPLSKANKIPLFVQLYKLAGSFSGNITFDISQPDTDLIGSDMTWYRPAQPTSQYYPDGWAGGFPFFFKGEKYNILVDTSVIVDLGEEDADGNASIGFERGLLNPGIGKNLNISDANVITKVDATDNSFTIKLNKTTGELTGTFTHTNGKTVKYQAITHQKGGAAGVYGYFMSPPTTPLDFAGEGGYVSLFPK